MVSLLVTPSFSVTMADSLISAKVLSTVHECYKNTFSKVIFHIHVATKIDLKLNFSARRINCKKPKTTIKKSGLVTGNTYFFVWPNDYRLKPLNTKS